MSKIKEYLEKIAAEEIWPDGEEYVNAYEFSGGNYDDAYASGCDTGRVELARELLKEFFDA